MEKGRGHATVLAMGTAVPPNVYYQKDYPDFYFNVTNSEHNNELKLRFQRMCEKSRITKRHLFLNEELLRSNPSICAYWDRSLDVRQDMVVVEVPKLAKVAATMAIKEWGQPKSKITHLIFCTTAGVDMPGADWALLKLLGLQNSVQRIMLYQQGCHGGGIALRTAKDLAENNHDARILVVCSEITTVTFRGPSDTHLDSLVGQALFGDGAAALIVGCGPFAPMEHTWFEVHRVASTVLPNSEGAIDGHLREVGLTFHLLKDVPSIIGKNIASIVKEMLSRAFVDNNLHGGDHSNANEENSLVETFSCNTMTTGMDNHENGDCVKGNIMVTAQQLLNPRPQPSYNDMFWIVHPGGPAILDHVEDKLCLDECKLQASRHILDQYGNMSSACVFFIMDHMRRSSFTRRLATSGEGQEWGFLLAFGPGLTCETILLRSLPLPN